MDQVKEYLVKVKPFAFWIACSVVLLMCLGTWYMATGTLHQQREENFNKINTVNTTLKGLEVKSRTHPNQASNQGMDELIRAYGLEIAAGWKQQYERQEVVLVWPQTFDQDFQNAVKDLRPIEKVPVLTPIGLAIPDSFRRRYRDFIEDELPKLATTIGGRWQARRDGSVDPSFNQQRTGPDGRPEELVDRSMVLWDPANQSQLLMEHFGFTAKEDDPSTLDVLYAQEDLWVLQNLMDIIKKTNDGAEGRHDAAVKQIVFVRIGRSALGNAGQVMVVGAGGPNTGVPGGMEGYRGAPTGPGVTQPGAPAAPGQTPAATATVAPPANPSADAAFNGKDPGNWRYVDQLNYPLAGFQLRAALTAPTELNALLTVAKRMPVRLRLEIDQRKLNRFLAEFGNAALPVEIRQIRINRDAAPIGDIASFFSAGAGGGAGGQYAPRSEGASGFAMRQPGGYGESGFGGFNPQGTGSLTKDATIDTNLIQLELYGIVYLYNPVNRSLLGLQPAGSPTAMTAPPPPAVTGG